MSPEEIQEELNRRIHAGLSGFRYGEQAHRILKIILNQAYIDGLLSFPPIEGKPLVIAGSVHEVTINVEFNI